MPATVERRFLDNLRALGLGGAPAHLLVAVSGGCDSVVLLHLLRFAARELPLRLTVAHLDHAMRPDSAADARWVAGVCRAWGLPLRSARLDVPPAGEDAARRQRYAFLHAAAREAGADRVLTAHHADDQAETVLFRALRGTGLAGLRGIPASTRSGVLRPLLPFWRAELEAYAERAGLRWRSDPTNREPGAARNRLRLDWLPRLEAEVAPGARRSLVALAALAEEAEGALERLAAAAERELVSAEGEARVLARAGLRDYDTAVAARVVRNVLRRFGVVLDRTGTRTALQFITDAPSGGELHLPAGLRIRLEFDAARVEPHRALPDDRSLEIRGPDAGEGALRLGGHGYRAEWRPSRERDALPSGGWSVRLGLDALRFPLQLRARLPGDRLRTPAGTKTLKQLFLERRVPRGERPRVPVLVDAHGAVLWVAGVGSAAPAGPHAAADFLILTVTNARFSADPGPHGGA